MLYISLHVLTLNGDLRYPIRQLIQAHQALNMKREGLRLSANPLFPRRMLLTTSLTPRFRHLASEAANLQRTKSQPDGVKP